MAERVSKSVYIALNRTRSSISKKHLRHRRELCAGLPRIRPNSSPIAAEIWAGVWARTFDGRLGAMEIIQTHKHHQSFVLSTQFKTFAMVRHVKFIASLAVYERGRLRIGQDQCNQMSLVGLSSVSMAQFAKARADAYKIWPAFGTCVEGFLEIVGKRKVSPVAVIGVLPVHFDSIPLKYPPAGSSQIRCKAQRV
jgi:hypothetical protein